MKSLFLNGNGWAIHGFELVKGLTDSLGQNFTILRTELTVHTRNGRSLNQNDHSSIRNDRSCIQNDRFCTSKKTAEPAAKIAPAKTAVKKPAAKKATIQPGSY